MNDEIKTENRASTIQKIVDMAKAGTGDASISATLKVKMQLVQAIRLFYDMRKTRSINIFEQTKKLPSGTSQMTISKFAIFRKLDMDIDKDYEFKAIGLDAKKKILILQFYE